MLTGYPLMALLKQLDGQVDFQGLGPELLNALRLYFAQKAETLTSNIVSDRAWVCGVFPLQDWLKIDAERLSRRLFWHERQHCPSLVFRSFVRQALDRMLFS
jgi:hypothetical protein